MAFMQAQMTDKRNWFLVDGTQGIEAFDCEDCTEAQARENYNGEVWTLERVTGYGVRASAPGYMDCTEYSVYKSESDAYDAWAELDAELREGEDA